MKRLLCLLVVLALALAAHAKDKPVASITATVTNLGCGTAAGGNAFAVHSWSWGAQNTVATTGTGGAGAGQAQIGDLVAGKSFDGCSPTLFGAVVSGKHYPSMTLVQLDSEGNVLLTVMLSDVLVSSWQVGGSVNMDVPAETVSFNFVKVCISEPSTGSKFCWDKSKGTAF